MGRIEKIDLLVDGGKASVTPALAQKLGPMKININNVITSINQKTKDFEGIQVPVKLEINTDTKEVGVKVGTPSVSALVKKELKLEIGAKGEADKRGKEIVGNLSMEQVVKIAKAKGFYDIAAGAKQVIGTCKSMGVTVEGVDPKELTKKIDAGEYDRFLKVQA